MNHYRDRETFKRIEDFDARQIVELTIDHSVPDLANFVVRVEEIGGGLESKIILESRPACVTS